MRWRDRIGDFQRDLGDGEHAEIMISDRTYRSASWGLCLSSLLALGLTPIRTRNFRSVSGDIPSDIGASRTESSNPPRSSGESERTLHRATTRRTSPRPEKLLRSEALLARMATRPMFSSTRSCRPIKGRCSGANVRPFAARWVNFAQCTPPLSVDPTRSGARAGRSGISATSPLARVSAKDRNPRAP